MTAAAALDIMAGTTNRLRVSSSTSTRSSRLLMEQLLQDELAAVTARIGWGVFQRVPNALNGQACVI